MSKRKEICIYTGYGHISGFLEKSSEGEAWIASNTGYVYGRLDFSRCKLIARCKEALPGVRMYDLEKIGNE